MKKEVKEYLDKIKPMIDKVSSYKLFEGANNWEDDPEFRKRYAKEISDTLPEGYTFEITEEGMGKLTAPNTPKDEE